MTPGILQSGTTTFVVRNTGKKSHVFAISGPGVKRARTRALLSAGKSAMLTVNLRTGSYMLSDPVGLGPYSVEYVNVIRAGRSRRRGSRERRGPAESRRRRCAAEPYAP